MNRNEFQMVFDKACAWFPGFWDWLQKNTTDMAETLAGWALALRKIDADEAVSVLEGWRDGTIPNPPVGYRQALFAADLAGVVHRRRSDANAERAKEERFREQYRARSTQRHPTMVRVGEAYLEIKAEIDKKNAGQFDQAELDRRIEAIQEKAFQDMQVMK